MIHPDNINKVLSFLLYLDNDDWQKQENKFGNGTQIWEVTDDYVPYDKNINSIDSQLRAGSNSNKIESLKEEEAELTKVFVRQVLKKNIKLEKIKPLRQ